MRDLDETDLEILQFLLADARRPYQPVLAVGAMAFSSASVLGNSLLFRRYEPDHDYELLGFRRWQSMTKSPQTDRTRRIVLVLRPPRPRSGRDDDRRGPRDVDVGWRDDGRIRRPDGRTRRNRGLPAMGPPVDARLARRSPGRWLPRVPLARGKSSARFRPRARELRLAYARGDLSEEEHETRRSRVEGE